MPFGLTHLFLDIYLQEKETCPKSIWLFILAVCAVGSKLEPTQAGKSVTGEIMCARSTQGSSIHPPDDDVLMCGWTLKTLCKAKEASHKILFTMSLPLCEVPAINNYTESK